MKSFVQILTTNSLLLLILGFLSISFYYSFFDVNISPYLQVSEIVLLSIPSFNVLINTLLFAMILAGPFLLISYLSATIIRKETKEPGVIVDTFRSDVMSKRLLINRRKNSAILIVEIIFSGFILIGALIKICRFFIAVFWRTQEFYLHPTSLLYSFLKNLFILFGFCMFIIVLNLILFNKHPKINHEVIAKKKIAPPLFISICFLINIYYNYANVCRLNDKVNYTFFIIKTTDQKDIYSSKNYKLIGLTKEYYFLKNKTDIIIIKASSILTHNIKIVNNFDTPDDMDFWNISYFSIIPPSLQKHN